MKYWIFACAVAGLAVYAAIYWIIPAFIFHPAKNVGATPSALGLDFEDVRLRTDDGETIAAWFVPAAPHASGSHASGSHAVGPDASPPGQGLTLLFFHGNAGNISHRLESIAFFHKLGLSVCIIDYRGFGNSTGRPSVSGTVLDARAAWQWLTVQRGIPASRIILFGRSLGGGVAAALAAEVTPKALILESTFTSVHDVAQEMFPPPPKFLFREDYPTLSNIKKLRVPLLVAHSPDDEVIPFHMGREIFDSYSGPKYFLRIRGSHSGGWFSDLAVYEPGVRTFLERLR